VCVRACMCVHACVHACMCVCVCACRWNPQRDSPALCSLTATDAAAAAAARDDLERPRGPSSRTSAAVTFSRCSSRLKSKLSFVLITDASQPSGLYFCCSLTGIMSLRNRTVCSTSVKTRVKFVHSVSGKGNNFYINQVDNFEWIS
jgi:hypothetical protein